MLPETMGDLHLQDDLPSLSFMLVKRHDVGVGIRGEKRAYIDSELFLVGVLDGRVIALYPLIMNELCC